MIALPRFPLPHSNWSKGRLVTCHGVWISLRLIVLDEGQVVEEGTHSGLIARGGLYGELFALQAEGYR